MNGSTFELEGSMVVKGFHNFGNSTYLVNFCTCTSSSLKYFHLLFFDALSVLTYVFLNGTSKTWILNDSHVKEAVLIYGSVRDDLGVSFI